MKKAILILISLLSIVPLHAAPTSDLNPEEMQNVLRIAKTIRLAKPSLDDSKCIEYSIGVYRASQRFNIEPSLLVAIAAQETYFREDLPEGKAGEYGIVQIRKMWIKNPKFQAVFKNAKIRDLNKPEKAFMFAAWILRDLKNTVKQGAIPFWSYYNAKKFHNRFKYYLAVNRKLGFLNKGEPIPVAIQADIQRNGRAKGETWNPRKDLLFASDAGLTDRTVATWRPSEIPEPAPSPATPTLVDPNNKSELLTTASLGGGVTIKKGGWIDLALKRLRESERPSNFEFKAKQKGATLSPGKRPQIKAENDFRSMLLRNRQD